MKVSLPHARSKRDCMLQSLHMFVINHSLVFKLHDLRVVHTCVRFQFGRMSWIYAKIALQFAHHFIMHFQNRCNEGGIGSIFLQRCPPKGKAQDV